jgi:tRNA (cmo5U34)-methyltransferase
MTQDTSDPRARDELFAGEASPAGDFLFDDAVAAVFPDMIRRSVPGYPAIINMIQLLAGRYAQPDTALIDLGCSTGASTVALALGCKEQACRIIGVDNAPAMLARARSQLAGRFPRIEWQCADVREVPLVDASVVVLNFTLQFLPPGDRLALLLRIRQCLVPGGVLILSEKIAAGDRVGDQLLVEMHHAFKRANGYSEMEISRKRTALEKVLIPETVATHRQRLQDAGFVRADLWFQCFNFVSLVASR